MLWLKFCLFVPFHAVATKWLIRLHLVGRGPKFSTNTQMTGKAATKDRKREDDVVARFSEKLHKRMAELYWGGSDHPNFAASPLGGQDWELADYLLAGIGQYCLVEFKADEDSAVSENRKPLRITLCENLQAQSALRAQAEDCHFLCWGEKKSEYVPSLSTYEIVLWASLAPYPGKVCPLLGYEMPPSALGAMTEDEFIEQFILTELVGVDAERFDDYVGELYKIAGADEKSGKGGFQGTVYIYIPPESESSAKLLAVEFNGIQHLFRLTKEKEVKKEKAVEKEKNMGKGMEFGL